MSFDLHGRDVLVGGGGGFFGSYLVPALVQRGTRVTVVDNFVNGDRHALSTLSDVVTIIEGDLRDRSTCDEVLRGRDVFINLAATASGVGFSRTHQAQMLVDNTVCGLLPLEAASRHGVRRTVMTSTSCVYPDDAPVPTAELDPFTGWPERVNEGYGWAKRIQELASSYYAREAGMNIVILRPFNLYGGNYPWRSSERAHVIPSLVKRVLDGEDPLVVWGSGEQRRDFLHARDAAELTVRVVESGHVGPVNLGYDRALRIADLARLICDVAGRHPRIVFDRSKPDGQASKSADSTLLESLTCGYTPGVSLRAGIEEMIDWYTRTFGAGTPARPVDPR